MQARFWLRETSLTIATVVPLAAGIALVIDAFVPATTDVRGSVFAWRSPVGSRRPRPEGRLISGVSPEDSRALLVMAELALARPSPEPEKALRRLERIHPDSPSFAAWVQIDSGNAHDLLSRHDRAEACWKEALRFDPFALEAGRRLLDLYTMQGRAAEARELALRQFDRERDPSRATPMALEAGPNRGGPAGALVGRESIRGGGPARYGRSPHHARVRAGAGLCEPGSGGRGDAATRPWTAIRTIRGPGMAS